MASLVRRLYQLLDRLQRDLLVETDLEAMIVNRLLVPFLIQIYDCVVWLDLLLEDFVKFGCTSPTPSISIQFSGRGCRHLTRINVKKISSVGRCGWFMSERFSAGRIWNATQACIRTWGRQFGQTILFGSFSGNGSSHKVPFVNRFDFWFARGSCKNWRKSPCHFVALRIWIWRLIKRASVFDWNRTSNKNILVF